MGTGQNRTAAQATIKKSPKCSICRKPIENTCDWRQGRCPHTPSLAEQVKASPYKARFHNLLKLFKRVK